MKYQNFKGDFTVMETFVRDGEQIPVPNRVVVHYFTKKYAGHITCERDGDSFKNCRLSADGKGLICSVALSRGTIGMGILCHNVIEVAENEDFPQGEQYTPYPEPVESEGDYIMLYDGLSDNTDEIISNVILSRINGVTKDDINSQIVEYGADIGFENFNEVFLNARFCHFEWPDGEPYAHDLRETLMSVLLPRTHFSMPDATVCFSGIVEAEPSEFEGGDVKCYRAIILTVRYDAISWRYSFREITEEVMGNLERFHNASIAEIDALFDGDSSPDGSSSGSSSGSEE